MPVIRMHLSDWAIDETTWTEILCRAVSEDSKFSKTVFLFKILDSSCWGSMLTGVDRHGFLWSWSRSTATLLPSSQKNIPQYQQADVLLTNFCLALRLARFSFSVKTVALVIHGRLGSGALRFWMDDRLVSKDQQIPTYARLCSKRSVADVSIRTTPEEGELLGKSLDIHKGPVFSFSSSWKYRRW